MNYNLLYTCITSFVNKRKKPIVIQMPITSRCNSRCVTCNIWKYKDNIDIDSESLRKAFLDPFFSEVHTVGLNGGEFTLMPNFINVLEAVLTLPKLTNIYLISNGLFPKRLFEYLVKSKVLCTQNNVKLNICISVDGYGSVHEKIRGIPNCFNRTKSIIDELYNNTKVYCDSFSVGCTLSKQNIEYIRETEAFFSRYKNLTVEYHLAVPNKRIKTYEDNDDYYILNENKTRFLATEFFFEKFKNAPEGRFKRQQFVNYYFLKNKGKGRLCKCDYLKRDITIDENLNIALCATASEIVGNLKESTATEIIQSKKTKKESSRIKKTCNTCIHYSYNQLTLRGRILYINELIHQKYALKYYSIATLNDNFLRFKSLICFFESICYEYLKYLYLYIWKLQ